MNKQKRKIEFNNRKEELEYEIKLCKSRLKTLNNKPKKIEESFDKKYERLQTNYEKKREQIIEDLNEQNEKMKKLEDLLKLEKEEVLEIVV